MVKSMTGFGKSEYSDGKRSITAEIKTVNHRFFDISIKMPRRYAFAEEAVKAAVKEKITRGKIDVSIIVDNVTENDTNISLNTLVARQYYDNLKKLAEEFDLKGDVSLQFLANLPDVMKAVPDVEDEEEITKALLIPVREAAARLDAMRAVEGEKLARDLIERGELIRSYAKKIEERAPLTIKNYTDKLRERISDMLKDTAIQVPEDRILLESAIFADKCNVTEELVRLNSHIDQLKKILESSNAEGKKLDFLVQEMNREANTIGSKANDIEVTNTMLEIKAEVEKIREQVQNIE